MQDINPRTAALLADLGLAEEPFGIHYSDTKPEGAFGPKECQPISRELEGEGKLDSQAMMANFSCFIGNIWLARKKKKAAFISTREWGCAGGGFYTGMYAPYINFIPHYVSTGFPGSPMTGERYMPDPESMRKFLDMVAPPPAPAAYCIAKPLSLFVDEEPEFITFFMRPEVLCGLYTLVMFTTGDVESVAAPFGPGCGHIVTWPLYYKNKGQERAVLGGFDPSARKFMKTDEMTLTIPLDLYRKMLDAAPESLLHTHTWDTVRKKVERSARAWGEGKNEQN